MVEIPTSQPTRICVVRHGETEWNAARRIQGQIDIALNDAGLRQAEAAGRWLRAAGIVALYSSDLQRAWVTARAIAETTQAPLAAHQGLRERSFGVLQGHTFEELEAKVRTLEREKAEMKNRYDNAVSSYNSLKLVKDAMLDDVARHQDMLLASFQSMADIVMLLVLVNLEMLYIR